MKIKKKIYSFGLIFILSLFMASGTVAASENNYKDSFKVAAVSASPAEFGVEKNLKKAAEITAAAAEEDAMLVAFPELWIPGYTDSDSLSNVGIQGIVENSIEVGSKEWQELLCIASDNEVYLSMSFIEKRGKYLYMSQVLVGPDGEVIDLRSKIRPSGGEREYLSDVEMEGNLNVSATELGRIGQLSCFEHFRPQSTYVLASQIENIHICAFPYGKTGTSANWWESSELELSAARYYAVSAECNVIFTSIGQAAILNSGGVVIASSASGDGTDYAIAEIDSTNFSKTPSYDSEGEYSWGIINMIRDSYKGAQEEDMEHGTLNKVEIPID